MKNFKSNTTKQDLNLDARTASSRDSHNWPGTSRHSQSCQNIWGQYVAAIYDLLQPQYNSKRKQR